MMNKLVDMDKIKQLGKEEEFCPYYYPFDTEELSSLYFMPYNYILD